jgi:hypothetical protein
VCECNTVRSSAGLAAVLAGVGLVAAAPAAAQPDTCDDAYCTPGITGGVVLGAPCDETTYYVFGTTSWGRLVFCGSPRRYGPRYFRSPPMQGVKNLGDDCPGYEDYVAQAPDGMFLTCLASNGRTSWVRGDT